MINEITASNVNGGLAEAMWQLRSRRGEEGVETRNGPVMMFHRPLVTTLLRPEERVLFWPLRDANPFFHLFEALWMLAGRNDVAWPGTFAKQMLEYSDDGYSLSGAYGYRWRRAFGRDQLALIVDALRKDPQSRRAVLQIWNLSPDLVNPGKDVPCNLSVTFDLRGGRLNSYIMNRSNDLIWGLFGANAVHFSVLQEYLAHWLGVPTGTMTTFSVNAHAYLGLKKLDKMLEMPFADDRYLAGTVYPSPLLGGDADIYHWDAQRDHFLRSPGDPKPLQDPFLAGTVQPMYRAWRFWRDKEISSALREVEHVEAGDWRTACREWLERRA